MTSESELQRHDPARSHDILASTRGLRVLPIVGETCDVTWPQPLSLHLLLSSPLPSSPSTVYITTPLTLSAAPSRRFPPWWPTCLVTTCGVRPCLPVSEKLYVWETNTGIATKHYSNAASLVVYLASNYWSLEGELTCDSIIWTIASSQQHRRELGRCL